ncbi:hypothetical protein PIB30_109127, partial [Stylosanthes scabra]|nr:hypothetical protein [Stylosanthes scabra]
MTGSDRFTDYHLVWATPMSGNLQRRASRSVTLGRGRQQGGASNYSTIASEGGLKVHTALNSPDELTEGLHVDGGMVARLFCDTDGYSASSTSDELRRDQERRRCTSTTDPEATRKDDGVPEKRHIQILLSRSDKNHGEGRHGEIDLLLKETNRRLQRTKTDRVLRFN